MILYDKQMYDVNLKVATFQFIWYYIVITVIETVFGNRARFLPKRNCVRFFEVGNMSSFHLVK